MLVLAGIVLAPGGGAADSRATAKVMIASGLLTEAERPRLLYRRALVRLDVPDEGDPGLATAILSTWPPAQVRQHWIRGLARRLDQATLAAARRFHESVPGRSLGNALTGVQQKLGETRRRELARRGPEAATDVTRALVAATGADTRGRILHIRATGMALWTARVVAGEARAEDLDQAFQDAVDAAPHPPRVAEHLAFADAPAPYQRGLLEFADSEMGRRFYAAANDALDEALATLARGQVGVLMERVVRRHPPRVPMETP